MDEQELKRIEQLAKSRFDFLWQQAEQLTSLRRDILNLASAYIVQQSEIKQLRESLEEIRDLCRTGVAPDSWNYTETEWLEHKINKSARIAATALEKTK